MSQSRYAVQDVGIREPHEVSLKVIRLSRPSLVVQHPFPAESNPASAAVAPASASLAFKSGGRSNPDPFILSPILNLPPSFGSAYVGETFSCTLCANHDLPDGPSQGRGGAPHKSIRDVYIQAEMKTPSSVKAMPLDLGHDEYGANTATSAIDLGCGQTLQKVVNFDLKEEGNHVLAVTVSYYEATETSGRTRTFRKLYQFICKASLIVRTKAGPLLAGPQGRRWVLEAQLENCSEEAIQLMRVNLDLDPALEYQDCNWGQGGSERPVLHSRGDVEQVCFVLAEQAGQRLEEPPDGKLLFGTLGIAWRNEMGNSGFLSTGRLGLRAGA